MKRIISLICVLAMLAVCAAVPCYAAEEESTTTEPDAPVVVGYQYSGVYQNSKNEDVRNIRFVAVGDDLTYSRVGFSISAVDHDKSWKRDSSTVYETLNAVGDDGSIEKISAQTYGSKYLFAYVVNGVPADSDIVFDVMAYAINANGETVNGEKKNITVTGVIKNAQDLQRVLTNGILNADYKVEAETLDLTGLEYSGLGTKNTPFTGTFDFGNCVVTGVSKPLFGYTSGAAVKNLVIENSAIEYTSSSDSRFGLVISQMQGGSLENVALKKNVSVNLKLTNNGTRYIGGMVGLVNNGPAECPDTVFENCVSYASITFTTETETGKKVYMGGIVGYVDTSSAKTTVTNCVNYGAVTNAVTGAYDSKVGGIAGALNSKTLVFNHNANYGAVTSNETNGQVAGICGFVNTDGFVIEFCINGGEMKGGGYHGGMIGYGNRNSLTLRYCVNTGNVEDVSNGGAIYGLAKGTQTIENCFYLSSNNSKGVGTSGTITVTNVESAADLTDLMSKLAAVEAMNGKFAVQNDTVVFVAA